MKPNKSCMRVKFSDGARMYLTPSDFNEVVQYMKRESVIEVTLSRDSIIETIDCML